jgi:nitrite reductase (NADH) small subunit/3-phenylpropionate/trans-cinnamate dioxygenase ferredoxin subunit
VTEDFIRIGRVGEFGGARGRAVRAGDAVVAVFKVGDRFHVIQDRCPHMGASLADGRIVDGRVECHWHHWSFDLESGRSSEREWACAAVWEVLVRGDELFVRPPASAGRAESAESDEIWEPWDPERHLRKKPARDGEGE